MTFTIGLAGPDDARIVADMWNRSAAWLRGIGSDQWQYPVKMHNITRAIENRECWLISDRGAVAATVTLNSYADPLLWYPSDDPEDALYVHRLVVDDTYRGRELGSAVLDWAATQAEVDGRKWLRLDAWRSNQELRKYYLRRGFKLVRVVSEDPSGSGACFQRAAAMRLGHGPPLRSIRDL